MILWTLQDLLTATGGVLHGQKADIQEAGITGISIDTRTLQQGDLFVALAGIRDGHDYVIEAFEKGAAAALVLHHQTASFAKAGLVIGVPHVLDALTVLGQAARARTGARILAITGSVGKTGTKEALKVVLSSQGKTHASVASYNNHFGVPLTLARMPEETEFGIFEIGMNHAFEILPLVAMVRPHVALITTVEAVHIEHFKSVEGIADAKGEIFSGLEPGGVAVLNHDNPHFVRLKAHALASPAGRIVSFGEHEQADMRALHIEAGADGSKVEAQFLGHPLSYHLGTPGKHIAQNSLGLLASVNALGGDVAKAAQELATIRPPAGRGERVLLQLAHGPALLIDESYNANPASMKASMENLSRIEATRRIVVLGDMLELGPSGPDLHRDLATVIEHYDIDHVFAAGPLMQECIRALLKPHIANHRIGGYAISAAELEPLVLAFLQPGDVVMVKGSNGSRIAHIARVLKTRFSSLP
jgi:UDP-N-acetylmuramoyl-tripeptide--D-alanyl-D-alanine ligase